MGGILLWFAALCACALLGWANYRRARRVAERLLDLRLAEPPPVGAGTSSPPGADPIGASERASSEGLGPMEPAVGARPGTPPAADP